MMSASATRLDRLPARPLGPALAILGLMTALAGTATAQAELGTLAPDFTLTGNDGETYTLSEVYGDQVQLLHMVGYA